jgi:hypothetical protein
MFVDCPRGDPHAVAARFATMRGGPHAGNDGKKALDWAADLHYERSFIQNDEIQAVVVVGTNTE